MRSWFKGFFWELMIEASLIWCFEEGQIVRNGQEFITLRHMRNGRDYETSWAVMPFFKGGT